MPKSLLPLSHLKSSTTIRSARKKKKNVHSGFSPGDAASTKAAPARKEAGSGEAAHRIGPTPPRRRGNLGRDSSQTASRPPCRAGPHSPAPTEPASAPRAFHPQPLLYCRTSADAPCLGLTATLGDGTRNLSPAPLAEGTAHCPTTGGCAPSAGKNSNRTCAEEAARSAPSPAFSPLPPKPASCPGGAGH